MWDALCRGHNGKVRSLRWSDNDAHLVSCGTEGAVYEWKLKTFKRSRENVLKVHRRPCMCTEATHSEQVFLALKASCCLQYSWPVLPKLCALSLFQCNTGAPMLDKHTCGTTGKHSSVNGSKICLHSSARYGHGLTLIETECKDKHGSGRLPVAQGCIYSCALATADLEHLYACSVDGKVCVLEDDEAMDTRIAASYRHGRGAHAALPAPRCAIAGACRLACCL